MMGKGIMGTATVFIDIRVERIIISSYEHAFKKPVGRDNFRDTFLRFLRAGSFPRA
jgi:hypothetical protein